LEERTGEEEESGEKESGEEEDSGEDKEGEVKKDKEEEHHGAAWRSQRLVRHESSYQQHHGTSIHLSLYPPVYLSTCLSIHLQVYISTDLSASAIALKGG
jgi:ABC-type Zn2+ transport system substrate-binding protein/surface adhesin